MKLKPDTNSYMQLCLQMDGRTLYLMVPTYFDETRKEWGGFVNLPKAKKTVVGRGKTSKELETNFNDELKKAFDEHPEETFSLFQPLSYWDEMMEKQ
jgi:hypothetical protein